MSAAAAAIVAAVAAVAPPGGVAPPGEEHDLLDIVKARVDARVQDLAETIWHRACEVSADIHFSSDSKLADMALAMEPRLRYLLAGLDVHKLERSWDEHGTRCQDLRIEWCLDPSAVVDVSNTFAHAHLRAACEALLVRTEEEAVRRRVLYNSADAVQERYLESLVREQTFKQVSDKLGLARAKGTRVSWIWFEQDVRDVLTWPAVLQGHNISPFIAQLRVQRLMTKKAFPSKTLLLSQQYRSRLLECDINNPKIWEHHNPINVNEWFQIEWLDIPAEVPPRSCVCM